MAVGQELIWQVWADNLESEFAALRNAVEQYPFISMVSVWILGIYGLYEL